MGLFADAFDAFLRAEFQRETVLGRTPDSIDIEDVDATRAWAAAHAPEFSKLSLDERRRLAVLYPLFSAGSQQELGDELVQELRASRAALVKLRRGPSKRLRDWMTTADHGLMEEWAISCGTLVRAPSFADRLLLVRWRAARKLRTQMEVNGLSEWAMRPVDVARAIEHEQFAHSGSGWYRSVSDWAVR